MNCVLEFPKSSIGIDFYRKRNNQKISLDILKIYGNMDIDTIAAALEVPVQRVYDICNGDSFLVGNKADNLAQLFLMFLAENFFCNCRLIRNFIN